MEGVQVDSTVCNSNIHAHLCCVLVMYCKFLNTWTNSQTSVMYQFQSLELLCIVIFYPTNKGFIRYQARQIVGKTKDQSHLDDLLNLYA